VAVGLNFLGFNPIKALVWAGMVQGFSTPPLLLMILLMTNNRKLMGDRVNSRLTNLLGCITVTATFSATLALVATWFI
jgi:Mn2+/Fe2+ NRAMP family transporter